MASTTPTYGSVSGRVWLDTNGNGIQDAGEAGLANSNVTLLRLKIDATGTTSTYSTSVTTDANGNYKFNLVDTAYSYAVEYDLPHDSKSSPADVGTNDTKDSDATYGGYEATHGFQYGYDDHGYSRTSAFTLKAGENKIKVDGGVIPLTRSYTSGYAWEDKNFDGHRSADDPGIAGVTVRLVHDTNRDGRISTDEVLATTTTDAQGHYEFHNEYNGPGYQLQFVEPTDYYWMGPRDINGAAPFIFDLVGGKALTNVDFGLDAQFTRDGIVSGFSTLR